MPMLLVCSSTSWLHALGPEPLVLRLPRRLRWGEPRPWHDRASTNAPQTTVTASIAAQHPSPYGHHSFECTIDTVAHSRPTRGRYVCLTQACPYRVTTGIRRSAPAGPPTTAPHYPVGHAPALGVRMRELPNVKITPPDNLTSGARGNLQYNPRRMSLGTAPGCSNPADALRTSRGWSRSLRGTSLLETMSRRKAV